MTWSYSRIKCFEDCPYRWFLKYIEEVPGIPKFYASYGSFMHRILEAYYKNKISKEEMRIRFLTGFQDEVQGERPGENIVSKYIKAGLEYLNTFSPFAYEPAAIEQEYHFTVGKGKYPFIGFIDYLGKDHDGFYIIDHKSRDLKPRTNRKKPTKSDALLDEMFRQQYIYSAAVFQEYGAFPKALCFNCFKTNTFIKEPFNTDEYERAVSWAENSIQSITNAEDFPPKIDYFACRYICDVSYECCYYEMR